jgi:hypothetical protein
MEMKIGKTYQNIKRQLIVEVTRKTTHEYSFGPITLYDVKIISSKNPESIGTFFEMSSNDQNWSEVVIDCDGLVYQLVD